MQTKCKGSLLLISEGFQSFNQSFNQSICQSANWSTWNGHNVKDWDSCNNCVPVRTLLIFFLPISQSINQPIKINQSINNIYLSSSTTEIVVHAFVSSKLDYCNSLLYRLSNYQEVKKLKHVQNTAVCLISLLRKHEHITPILLNLH